MRFYWLIFLSLWTVLSGPVLARPVLSTSAPATRASVQPKSKPSSHRPQPRRI